MGRGVRLDPLSVPRLLPLVLLAAVGLRLAILEHDLEAVAIPAYELSTTGNLAYLESADQQGPPLHRHYDNCGARLVAGLLGAGLFATIDDSYRTLKLVPLTTFVLALLLLWWLVDRHVDRKTANLAALLFATLPPTLVRFSLLAMGSHFESLPFQFAVWFLFLETHARGIDRRWLAATGLAAGVTLFVSFGSAVLLVVLAAQHLLRRRGRTLQDLAVAVPAFLVGLTPLFWIHAQTEGRPARFLVQNLPTTETAASLADKARELFTDVLPRSPTFEDVAGLPGRALDLAFLLVLVVAWIRIARDLVCARRTGARRPLSAGVPSPVLTALLHFPVFLVFALVTRFDFDTYGAHTEVGRYRYLVPSFAFAAVLLAAALRGPRSPVRFALAAACLLFAFAGSFVADPWSGTSTRHRGHALEFHARTVLGGVPRDERTGRLRADVAAAAEDWTGLSGAARSDVVFGLGHLLSLDAEDTCDDDVEVLLSIVAAFPPLDRADLARGIGSHLRTREARDGFVLRERLLALREADATLAHHVAVGLALPFRIVLHRDLASVLARNAQLAKAVPPPLRSAFARGLGASAGRLVTRASVPAEAALRPLAPLGLDDETLAKDVWFGFGLALAEDASPLTPRLLSFVPSSHAAAFSSGYGLGLRRRLPKDQLDAAQEALLRTHPTLPAAPLERALTWPLDAPPFPLP